MILNPPNQHIPYTSGSGEMGKLIREYKWDTTVLGEMSQWPQSLLTTLNLVLHSKFPMFLFWGPELTGFYNDAFRPSLGQQGKHPSILGMSGRNAWAEVWDETGVLIEQVMNGGEAVWQEDRLVPIFRNGRMEEAYWTFCYSPVYSDAEKPAGVLVLCTETTEKVNTVRTLVESKNELEFAIEAAELGTFDYNPVTNKFSANARLKHWFGLDAKAEIDLSHAVNSIASYDRQRVITAIEAALQPSSGGQYRIEYTIVHPRSKKETIVLAKGRVWFDDANQPFRFNGTLQDITSEANARKKLKESEQKFRSLVEQSPVATCLFIGREMKIEVANDLMLQLWGKGGSVMGKPLAEALPELVGQPFLQILDEVFSSGKTYEAKQAKAELVVDGQPGTYYFDYLYKPLFNETGEVYGIMDMATDVTQQVLSVKKNEESERRFRNIVEQAPMGITILRGHEFIVEMANEAYLQIVDRTESEFAGRSLFDSLPEVREAVEPLLENVLTTNVPYFGNEFPVYINRYGKQELAYFNFVYHPLHEGDGQNSRVIVVANEVTALVNAKHLLAESEKQFRNMVMQSPIAMTILRGSEYVIELANDKMLRDIWNKFPGDVIGRKLLDVFPELNDQKYAALLHNVYATGDAYRETEAYGFINGPAGKKEFYLDYEYAPIWESDNTISRIMVTINDVTEKVQARKQIEESAQRIRNFVESAPFPIGIYIGKEMTIEFVNQSIIDVWGKGRDVVGKTFSEVLPELAGKGIYEQLDSVYTTGIPYHAKNRRVDLVVHGIPGQYYFNYSYTPLRNADGSIYGVMNTAADVTDIMLAHQSVAESGEKLNIVIEASELGTWEWNLANDEVLYSDKFLQIFGFPCTDHVTHEEMLARIHPEDMAARNAGIKKALTSGTLHYFIRIFKGDGSTRWIETRGKVIFDGNNRPYKLLGTIEDITEQKSYQQDLEEREEKFRLLAESMPLFVWTADINGNFTYFNHSVYSYSGLDPVQLDNEGLNKLVHPDDRESHIEEWIDAFTSGKEFLAEQRFRRHDGAYRWRLTRTVPQRDALGNIQMWVGTSIDIHDQKEFVTELEKQVQERTKELKQKNIDLEKINKELQSFAYISSHDLQEPLRKIQTFASFVLEKEYQSLTDRAKDYFSRMQNSARRMQLLINDLLSYSKTQTSERIYERTGLASIIAEVQYELKEELQQKNAAINLKNDCEINIVPFQFRQLFYNLVSNSIKFAKPQTPVEIQIDCTIIQGKDPDHDKFEKHLQYVHIQYSDNGIGFDQQYGEKVFELFQRLHSKSDYQGTGIGLAIVKKIVENHNGIITAQGAINKGVTFDIYIPMN